MSNLNWKKGLFRIWLVLSSFWLIVVGFLIYNNNGIKYVEKIRMRAKLESLREESLTSPKVAFDKFINEFKDHKRFLFEDLLVEQTINDYIKKTDREINVLKISLANGILILVLTPIFAFILYNSVFWAISGFKK